LIVHILAMMKHIESLNRALFAPTGKSRGATPPGIVQKFAWVGLPSRRMGGAIVDSSEEQEQR
jgi:hypothetical protein